jgi:hypothetical protein
MAVVIGKSKAITNRDASPRVINNAGYANGIKKCFAGQLEGANGDSVGSTFIMGSIPSNAYIKEVLLSCDAMVAGAADIGLYKNTEQGSAVVDADFFASAVVLNGALTNSDVTHESGVFGIEHKEKMVWEVLGLSSDPSIDYDVVLTLTTGLGAAGTLALNCDYAI